MKFLVVIPARGGSKGIPMKNIYPLNGKPLLSYSLEMMCQVEFDGDVVVSTDSGQIKEAALLTPGIEVVDRPQDISGDKASTESALLHALEVMEERKGYTYDAVVTLQATSPLRRAETVEACFNQYEQDRDKYDALLTLTETRTDYWIKEGENHYRRLYPDAPRRRQDREPIYIENSAVYITDRQSLLDTGSVLGHRVNGYVIPEKEGVDINEPIDIVLAEELIKERDKVSMKNENDHD